LDRKWWTLIAVCLGTFMLLLDVTIVNVALPDIQSSLKASFSDLQWVVDAYALTLAALLLTTGSLADLFGRRRLFVIGLAIFSASSLLSGLAQSPLWLNLARGAQGVGGAAMFSTSLALLGNAFQGRERGVAFGVWGAITGVAVAVGPVVGGALTSGISWRWIFLVNVPIGVVSIVLCTMRVEESKQPGAPRPDLFGFVTFSGALGALIYALIKVGTKGWGDTVILACFAAFVVLLIAFIVGEALLGDRAMFDLKLLRKPTFNGGLIAAFALSAGLFSLFLYLTLYLQDVLRYTAFQTGLRFLVLSGAILLTSGLAGRLTAVVPIRFLIAPGLALVGIGLLLMRGLTPASGWTHLIPGFIVAGAGTGFVNPPLASTAIGVVRPERAGMASGINSTFRQIGIATGIAGLGSLFSHTVRTHIVSTLTATHVVGGHAADALARTVAQGNGAASALGGLPPRARPAAVHAVRASFVSGLNDVFLIGALLVLISAALTLVLIRSKDFEVGAARAAVPEGGRGAEPAGAPAPAPAAERAPATDRAAAEGAASPHQEAPPPLRLATASPAQDPDRIIADHTEAMISAVKQAQRDYGRDLERQIEDNRAAAVAGAEAEARRALQAALERSEAHAATLRDRFAAISEECDRLVAELRAQADSAARRSQDAAATRADVYHLIGELGQLLGDGEPAAGAGDGSGTGRPSAPARRTESA
jgi:EmrB/QacA subfamily drug resistance transporter